MSRLYRVAQAAEELAIGETRLREIIAAGELLAVHVGDRAIRIPASELDRYVEERLQAERARRGEVAGSPRD